MYALDKDDMSLLDCEDTNRPPLMSMVWVRDRIRLLIDRSGRTERSFSLELDHSHNYINKILNGVNDPKWKDFFYMVYVLRMRVTDFFDDDLEQPLMISQIMTELKAMNSEQQQDILNICKQINKTHDNQG